MRVGLAVVVLIAVVTTSFAPVGALLRCVHAKG